MTMQEPVPVGTPSSGLALAGLLTSCASLVLCPLAGVAGVIMSVIAWSKASKDPVHFGGKGMAIAGTMIGTFSTVVIPLLMIGILLPALGAAREVAGQLRCATNLRMISQVMVLYEQSYGELPPADDWVNVLIAEGLVPREAFVCPDSTDPSVVSYHFVPTDQVTWDAQDVLVYEWPAHHTDGANVGYADTRVVVEPEARLEMILHGLTLPDGTKPHERPMPAPR